MTGFSGKHAATLARRAFSMVELMVAIVIIAILAAITLSIGSAVLESADRRKTQDMLSLLDAAMIEYQQHTGRSLTSGQGDGAGSLPYDDKPLNGVSSYDLPIRGVYTQTQPDGIGFLEDFSVGPDDFDSWESAVANRAGRRMMVALLNELKRVASSKAILAKIGDSFWEYRDPANPDPDDAYVIDAWGRPVLVVFGGRGWYTGAVSSSGLNDAESEGTTDTSLKDEDGTIRTFEERAFGPARGQRTYFMSPGPDQRYGWLDYTHGTGGAFTPAQDAVTFRRTQDNLYSYEVRQW
ncbi:MAG: prepilin-type N-terminal cleavage/methylation domain-containing protein [Phycisphaerales bacterium]|jgi:prepilin-type N-terminal cleavage/methylation domain-containing protein|nr:prepilin-type N-terminal cleavage/methylation domain-containing protein [Phycisphaerales bacterium]